MKYKRFSKIKIDLRKRKRLSETNYFFGSHDTHDVVDLVVMILMTLLIKNELIMTLAVM